MREEETMDIIVNGARGRMGQEVCRLLQEDAPIRASDAVLERT